MYRRLTETLNDKGQLIPTTEEPSAYVDSDKDWYYSIYEYNEDQYKAFLRNRIS